MSNKPRVSVLIPSYNHAVYIEEAIESILGQTLGDFELIIVDDGSTDNSWEIIKRYAALDSRVIVIRQENQGPSTATNRAFKQSSGEFIAAHTSDDRSTSVRLEKQVAFLDANAEYDAVASFIEEIDSNGQIRTNGAYESWFNVTSDPHNPCSWVWKNIVASPTLTFRRNFFERYGAYDRDLVYTQDWELLIRAVSMGCKLAILPERLFQYRSHDNNLTHKSPTGTFWEYAYISSKILHSWLMKSGNGNLVLTNIAGFLNHETFAKTDRNERIALANALLHNFRGSFRDFLLNRDEGSKRNHEIEAKLIEEAHALIQIERDQLLAERNKLRDELDQLQTEKTKLQAERDQLQVKLNQFHLEISSLAYRATKKARYVLQTRMPPAYYLAGKILRLIHRIWQIRPIESYLRLKTKLYTRSIVNKPWPEKQPLISVIIPCFNYGNFLNQAIDSVLNQTFQDFEIIVVDDESTDPFTRDVLASLNKPKTQLIRQENQRVSMARNNGIKKARGKYICCLDADDLLTPTYLEKCVYWLETKHFDICYSWVQLFGDSDFLWHTAPFTLDELFQGNIVSTAAVFRRAAWERAGGYKSQMQHGYEDWEFWLRLARNGARGHRIPEPLFLYRKHGTSLTTQTDAIHDKLWSDVQAFHADLRKDRIALADLERQQLRQYLVKNAFANLLRSATPSRPNNRSSLKILLSVPWFDLGGSSVLMKEIFSYLRTLSVQATAIATNPSVDFQANEGLLLYESFTSHCFSLPTFLENEDPVEFIKYLIASRKVDIVFLVGSRLIYESLPQLKGLFPTLKVVDQLYNTVGHVKSNREFSRYIDLNLVANDEIRDHLIELGESADRIRVIPHGIEMTEFSSSNTHYVARLIRRTVREFTFGFMGRLSNEKRPQDIVELAIKLPKCHFRIRGDGPMESTLRKQVLSHELGDRVHFDKRFKQPVEFYASIDALIVPSEIEGLPLVLLEAMALELPVVATRVGHIPTAISHGDNGFLYDVGQIDQLAALAEQLVRMPQQKRSDLGKKARKTVLDEYSISKCASRYLDAFNSVRDTIV